MDLKNTVKWKKSVTRDHVLYNHNLSRMGTFVQTEGRLLVAFGGMKRTLNEFKVSIWSNENVLKLDCGDNCTTPQMFPRTHWTTFTLKRWPLWYTNYIPTQLFLKTVMGFKCMHLTNAFTILMWFQPQCVAPFGDNIKSSEGWEILGTMEPLV